MQCLPISSLGFFFLLDNCLALHFALEKLPQHFSFRKNRKAWSLLLIFLWGIFWTSAYIFMFVHNLLTEFLCYVFFFFLSSALRRLWDGGITAFSFLVEKRQVAAGVHSAKTASNVMGHKLQHSHFWLYIGRKIFTMREVGRWKDLPAGAVAFLSLEVLRRQLDVVLSILINLDLLWVVVWWPSDVHFNLNYSAAPGLLQLKTKFPLLSHRPGV